MTLADDPSIDPAVHQMARLAALEHSLAVQWYTFACNQSDRLDLPVIEVCQAFKDGVCGALLDGWRDVPAPLRDLVRAHAARTMDHVLAMATLNDRLTKGGQARPV